MEKVKERKSNIELLRIFAMILIILHHYSLHGGLISIDNNVINKMIGGIALIGGKIGVNIFVLIMGYFLIDSKFNFKKFLKLILQVLTYTVTFFIINLFIRGNIDFDIIKKSFFPTTFGTYWFITTYVVIYILSPYINYFIKNIEIEKLELLIFILIILFSFVGLISSKFMGDIHWFFLIYIIGAYIKIYSVNINTKYFGKFSFIGYLLLIIMSCILIFLNQYSDIFYKILIKIISMNSIIVLTESVLLFLYFNNLNIKSNKIINILGKASFGVYLLHENLIFRKLLWSNICKVQLFYFVNPLILILHILICMIGIYIIGTLIEIVRIILIEKNLFRIKFLDSLFNKIDNKLNF